MVKEARHEAEAERRHQSAQSSPGAGSPQVHQPDAQTGKHHAGEAETGALHRKQVPALVKEKVGQREQRLDQRRVLVVHAPGAVHVSQRDCGGVPELLEPALVESRGLKVGTFVARISEAAHGVDQQDDVRRGDERGQRQISEARGLRLAERLQSLSPARRDGDEIRLAHRVLASKQKWRFW